MLLLSPSRFPTQEIPLRRLSGSDRPQKPLDEAPLPFHSTHPGQRNYNQKDAQIKQTRRRRRLDTSPHPFPNADKSPRPTTEMRGTPGQ